MQVDERGLPNIDNIVDDLKPKQLLSTNERLECLENYCEYISQVIANHGIKILSLDRFIQRYNMEINNGREWI